MAGIIKVDRVQSDSNLAFQVAGANVAYMNSTGLQMTGGTLSLGGTTIIPAVGQIAFPATQNASADANTLDDYEEGTWTPTVTQSVSNPTSVVYNRQHGTYIKIGTFVYLTFNLYITSLTNGSGTVRISNLPFTCQNVNESDRACMTIGYCSGFTSTNSPQGGIIVNNNTIIDITTQNSADARDGRSSYTTNTGTSINLYATLVYRCNA